MNDKRKIERKVGLSKVSIDMHLGNYRVVNQQGHCPPKPAQKFDPKGFEKWLGKEIGQSDRVVVSYEAGCFGYEPARRMQAMGAEVLVIAPQDWDEQKKKQVTDKLDAQVMCRRLGQYLDGDRKALSVVRIPTREEEIGRRPGRLRDQLRREIRRMQSMGRSLLLQREMAVKGRWWAGKLWEQILQQMPGWVIGELEIWKKLILKLVEEVEKIEAEIEKAAPKGLFVGEGALTHELIGRELADMHRFKNARQVGNYFGLCPSESTSGTVRHLGSITKHGNRRLRTMLVELAWRVLRYQPHYRGVGKWGPILRNRQLGAGARKKAIVALARWLAVDLWRMSTGRKTARELGLTQRSA